MYPSPVKASPVRVVALGDDLQEALERKDDSGDFRDEHEEEAHAGTVLTAVGLQVDARRDANQQDAHQHDGLKPRSKHNFVVDKPR